MKKILVCKETDPLETRTPLIPDDVKRLISMGFEIKAVKGTGEKSGFTDEPYKKAGAVMVSSNEEGYKGSDIILRIMKPEKLDGIENGALHLSYLDPFNEKELTPEQIAKQQEAQAKVCEKSNIVITTAKVFGRKAPVLIKKNVLDRMMPGFIVVDMAVSTGGNVEGSKLFENVVTENGVTTKARRFTECRSSTHSRQERYSCSSVVRVQASRASRTRCSLTTTP